MPEINPTRWESGDLVYLYRPVTNPGNASKLTRKYEPGYVVSDCLTMTQLRARRPGSKKPPEKVHCDRLKPRPVSHVYRDGPYVSGWPGKGCDVVQVCADLSHCRGTVGRYRSPATDSLGQGKFSDPTIPLRSSAVGTMIERDFRPGSGDTGVLEALGPGICMVPPPMENRDRMCPIPVARRMAYRADSPSEDRCSGTSCSLRSRLVLRGRLRDINDPQRTRRAPDRYSP